MKPATLILLACLSVGCSSKSAPPKPSNQPKQVSPEEMKKIMAEQGAQQPCSEQNLKNATPEQKQKCSQGQHMFDRPSQPPKKPATPPKH